MGARGAEEGGNDETGAGGGTAMQSPGDQDFEIFAYSILEIFFVHEYSDEISKYCVQYLGSIPISVKLKHFEKFQDTTEALAAATALVEGKIGKSLKKVLKKVVAKEAHEQLAISDAKLGGVIKDKLNLSCVHNTAIAELMRGIRNQMESLITGLPPREISAMSLGLAHSLSRYKLKFSPDKVDTMIVQAISLLDDLDKELNNYIMRCREWYGWHFPEIGKIITDNLAYCKSVKKIGVRTNVATTDLSDILPEEVEGEVKTAAEISMGTEVSEEDIGNILHLCDQVIEISEYRAQLYDYLKNRMMAIAPNLTVMVGELVGARLIAHAGSLLNLAKHPASTVQILGAEKALFRALKTKRDTPKYGLIYHASLVGQTTPKNKGKISRMLAAKAALAIRYDALGEDTNTELGVESRAKLEVRLRHLEEKGISRMLAAKAALAIRYDALGEDTNTELGVESRAKLEVRLRHLEEKGIRRISGTGKAMAKTEKYQHKSEVKTYDPSGDSTLPSVSKKRKLEEAEEPTEVKVKKMKKERIPEEAEEEEEEAAAAAAAAAEEPPKKKKKKHEPAEEEEPAAVEEISRMLAAKAALAIRYDALGEDTNTELGVESRAKLEVRLRHLEEKGIRRISGTGKAMAKTEKYQHKRWALSRPKFKDFCLLAH
ncbi:UNVERIFIED_CONTAM: hypothetical protein FKN15_043118 [Acipenser sinensis]